MVPVSPFPAMLASGFSVSPMALRFSGGCIVFWGKEKRKKKKKKSGLWRGSGHIMDYSGDEWLQSNDVGHFLSCLTVLVSRLTAGTIVDSGVVLLCFTLCLSLC